MISLELVVNLNYLLTQNYPDSLKQLMNKTPRQKIVIDERRAYSRANMFMRTDYTNIKPVLIVYSASHLSLYSLPVSLSVYQVPSGRLHPSTCTVLYSGVHGTTTTLTFAEARGCFLSFSRELISLSCLNE